ncbi:MAG: DUF5615 family PIN-like protein [Alphaproteobacteria bacterium]|nr:DUF5615 family PIN-like protein [Alphaproteobacteria bacterium]
MKLLADTNVVALAVSTLRSAGHDVQHVAERSVDPGDIAILAEAHAERRILVSKDTDIGTLVFRDGYPHAGVLLIDDLGSASAETTLLVALLSRWSSELTSGSFIRAGQWGSRVVLAT